MGNSKSKREKEARLRDMEERKKRQEAEQKRIQEEEERKRREEWEKRQTPLSFAITASSRAYFARKDFERLKSVAARRARIAEEIFQTEKSYINSLNTLLDKFYKPLWKASLNAEDKKLRNHHKRRKRQSSMKDKEDLEVYYKGSGSVIRDSSKLRASSSASPGMASTLSYSSSIETTKPRSSTLSNLRNPMEDDETLIVAPDIEISKEDVKAMFSQIEVILLYNDKLAQRLEERVTAWHWTQQLGDIFIEMLDFLKTYIQYVNNYNTAINKIDKLKEVSPAFCEWLLKTESNECKGTSITSYLIMPIQRIPRYVLLLEDLVKHTPPPHVDNKNLVTALTRMKDVAVLINEKKREVESFEKMLEIYNRLEPKLENLCEAHRRFEKDGYIKEDGAQYHLYLFNDILLKTKEEGKKLRLLTHVTLKTAQCVDVPDDKSRKIKNSFQITTPRKTFTLKAPSHEEKQAWIKAIGSCINQQLEKSKTFSNLSKIESQ